MVVKGTQNATEPPRKRPKLDPKKPSRKFTSVEEIRAGLRIQSPEGLTETLTALRNQLSIKPGEDSISPQDARLLLAQHWMESVPGAHDIFEIWDNTTQRQTSALALIVSVLSSVLSLLSSHYTFHTLGQPILKTLLTPPYTRRLNSYIGGSHSELILTTIKLYNGMSTFAGGRERNAVLDAFGWEIKSLPKILNMRRKTKGETVVDPLIKPDIRTLYILFLLSFVDVGSSTQTKTTFLEQHRDAFLSMFKGLVQDSYPVARKILEVCWSGVWSDPKIKRTVKIGLFNETTISHLAKLYERTVSEDDEAEQVPADLVHHFLLAICTRPGVGICFRDRGWYPRETDGDERTGKEDDDYEPTKRGGKIYNKILSNVLKTLKVNEDVRQQELAMKILAACPELVVGYWSGAALTLEPRLSSKWIANISLFGSIISLPIPSETFRLPGGTLYQPTPPPLNSIMENILPSVNTKAHFSKGLLSSSGLVQHCTALALAKCLNKYQQVLALFSQIETILEESEADGQWCKRRRDIEREARRRVPEFQVIVAFSQQKLGEGASAGGATSVPPNPTKVALLSESAQRLLWMYHRCLPLMVAEARFDVGKLLQNFSTDVRTSKVNPESDDQDEPPDAAARLHMVRQLHVLRLLKDSDQFVWSGKMGSSPQSYLATLLKAYAVSNHPATRSALAGLLNHVLAESIMFQEDPDGPHPWLDSLPTSRRAPGSESPDGASLTDEADGVISFLDDCVQRCMKTPYRYMEELYSFGNPDNTDPNEGFSEHHDIYPSPLLMTVLEQLDIKVGKKILSASDVFALASFLRKLVYRLMAKQQSLQFLRCVLNKVDGILDSSRLFPQYPVVAGAIRREVSLLRTCLEGPQISSPEFNGRSQATQDFLNQVEKLPIPASKQQRALAASEFIDWVRLVDTTLGQSELRRVSDILLAFHPPAITDLAEYTVPMQGSLWYGLNIHSNFSQVQKYLRFHSLFLHSSEAETEDAAYRSILVDVAFGGVSSLLTIKSAVSLIVHRLTIARSHETLTKGLLLLLASVVERALTLFSAEDIGALKETIFAQSEVITVYLISETISECIREALHNLVKVSFDSTSQTDQLLLADTTTYWLDALKRSLTGEPIKTALVLTWIPYFQSTDLLGILDTLSEIISSSSSSSLVLETVLHSLRSSTGAESSSELALNLKTRLPQLLSLREAIPDLAILEEIIATAVVTSVPAYGDGSRLVGELFEEITLSSIMARSKMRWSQHLDRLPDELPLQSFLDQTTWTASTIEILTSLLYRRSIPKDRFISWLETDGPTRHSTEQLIPVLHAFLDASSCDGYKIEKPNVDTWISLVAKLLEAITAHHLSPGLESMSSSCITLIASLTPSCLPRTLASIVNTIDALPVTFLTTSLLNLGHQLHSVFPADAAPFLTALVNQGMQWAVRRIAEEGESFEAIVEELAHLVQVSSDIKPHLAETVIGVVIHHHLANVSALKLITSLLSRVQFKPVVINRFLQSIIQHPQIFKLCGSTASSVHVSRDAIVNTLYVLFNLHPNNTCQITHVEPLVRLYRGTLSVSDGQILTIFRLFETQRKMSIAPLLNRWSSSPDLPSVTSLDAIHSLDAIVVLRTCLSFPSWRRLDDSSTAQATAHDAQLYDPIFLILLFSQTLTENPPSSAFAWVELFRTNIVSLLIRAMSSKDDGIRDAALCQLAGLWECLVDADLQEKPHVVYILTLLKNLLPIPSDEPSKRFPSYTTLILLHALRGIFYPSNFIYPITARFLLQRPELDITDVPMLYNMLYSSTDDWKKERGWMIRFLSDGMMSTEDWRVLKRRHTWDLLASLFQSSEGDHALRSGIFEILANLTCNAQATTSLCLKSGLLAWIEIQLITSKDTETVEWIKILDNIMTIGNVDKFESSTNGEWRNVIGRCFVILLHPDRASNTPGIFPFAVSALLRLTLLQGPRIIDLPCLLDHGLSYLKQTELTLVIPPAGTRVHTLKKAIQTAPFRAHDIHELFSGEDGLQTWGTAVEALWRITMTFDNKPPVWDALTARLLVWRAVVGAEDSSLGEWARKQVVHNMGT